VEAVRQESETLWLKGFAKEMSFKSGLKGRGSECKKCISREMQLFHDHCDTINMAVPMNKRGLLDTRHRA